MVEKIKNPLQIPILAVYCQILGLFLKFKYSSSEMRLEGNPKYVKRRSKEGMKCRGLLVRLSVTERLDYFAISYSRI